jgi:hypothetical protein
MKYVHFNIINRSISAFPVTSRNTPLPREKKSLRSHSYILTLQPLCTLSTLVFAQDADRTRRSMCMRPTISTHSTHISIAGGISAPWQHPNQTDWYGNLFHTYNPRSNTYSSCRKPRWLFHSPARAFQTPPTTSNSRFEASRSRLQRALSTSLEATRPSD